MPVKVTGGEICHSGSMTGVLVRSYPQSHFPRLARRLAGWMPREHGSWALALEPLLLALLAAPSAGGAAVAAAGVVLFLSRRPCQDAWIQGRRTGAVVAAVAALWIVGGIIGWAWLLGPVAPAAAGVALAGAAIFGVGFVLGARHGARRSLLAECAGAGVFAAWGGAVAACGADPSLVAAVGLCAAMRAAMVVVPLRVLLRRRKGGRIEPVAVPLAVGVGMLAGGSAAWAAASWAPSVWAGVFAGRAIWLGGSAASTCPVRRLGVQEAVLGLLATLTLGISIS